MKNRYILDPSGKVISISEDNVQNNKLDLNNSTEKSGLYLDIDHFGDESFNQTYLSNYIANFGEENFSTSVEIDNIDLTNVLFGSNKENFSNAVRQIIVDKNPSFGFFSPEGNKNDSINQGAYRQFNSFLDTEGGLGAASSNVIPYVDEFEFYTGFRDTIIDESALIPSLALVFEYLIDVLIEAAIIEAIIALNKLNDNNVKKGNRLEGFSKESSNTLVLGEYIFTEVDVFSRYFFEVLNYPIEEGSVSGSYFLKRTACYFIGLNEWLSHDRVLDWDVILEKIYEGTRYGLSFIVGGNAAEATAVLLTKTIDITLSSLTNSASLKRIMLLIKKFNTQKYWVQNQLYSAKRKSDFTSIIADSLNYYYFKFFIERVNVGIKIWNRNFDSESINNLVDEGKNKTNRLSQEFSKRPKSNSINYSKNKDADKIRENVTDILSGTLSPQQKISAIENIKSNIESANTYTAEYNFDYNFNTFNISNIPTALMFNKSISNVNDQLPGESVQDKKFFAKTNNKKLPIELVNKIEESLESEYMPFYFHDLRTNEILSFHAFIENISDSYTPDYVATGGFGRLDDVRTYNKTTRSISLSFIVAATSKSDHDTMWYYINKLVTLVYPQWSRGEDLIFDKNNIQQPFSQVPTNSPLIRMRVGDLIKSNYTRQGLSRIFGLDEKFNKDHNELKTDEIDWSATTKKRIEKRKSILIAQLKKAGVSFKRISPEFIKIHHERIVPIVKKTSSGTDAIKEKTKNLKVFTFKVVDEDNNINTYLPTPIDKNLVGNFNYIKLNEHINSIHFNDLFMQIKNYLLDYYIGSSFSTDSGFNIFESYDYEAFIKKYTKENVLVKSKNIKYKLGLDRSKFKSSQNEIMRSFDENNNLNNPITQAYESGMSKGLAGHITSLSFDYANYTWEIDEGSKAPMMVKVSIQFAPIHDIPLGLDYKGMPRAVNYTVGEINRAMFGEPGNPLQKYKNGEES